MHDARAERVKRAHHMHEVRGEHRDGSGERECGAGVETVNNGERHDGIGCNAHVDRHSATHRKGAHIRELEGDAQLEALLEVAEDQADQKAAHQRTLAGIATEHHAAERGERIGQVIQNCYEQYLNEVGHECTPAFDLAFAHVRFGVVNAGLMISSVPRASRTFRSSI